MHYPVVIHKDKNSDYGVIVPDMPGCFSAGDTYEDALINAREAIEYHLEGMLVDGEPLPLMGKTEDYMNRDEYAGGVWALVGVDLSQLSGKAKRINITLPERILKLIDLHAKHQGENRSAFLAEAAINYISQEKVGG